MIFINFRAVYDFIQREKLIKVMRGMAIPEKLISLIKNIYEESRCRVTTGCRKSDSFIVGEKLISSPHV